MAITELGQNTPQGSAFYGLQDALGGINGQIPSTPAGDASLQNYYQTLAAAEAAKANIPAWAQQQQVSQMQAAGIPQETKYAANINDIYKLFLADTNLASQYMRPDMQKPGIPTMQPSDTPTFGSVGVPSTPLMTLGSVGAPFTGFTTPGLAQSMVGAEGKSMTDMLKNIFDLINAQKTGIGETTTNAANMYAAKLNAITNMANIAKSMYDESGGLSGLGDLSGTDIAGEDMFSQKKRFQQAWYRAKTTDKKNAIAKAWSNAHRGSSLFPEKLSSTEIVKVQDTMSTLDRVNRLITVINRYQNKFPQGLEGRMAESMVGLGIQGTLDQKGILKMPTDIQQAFGDMIALRGSGDRELIGGRLTGYLLERLGVAFPGAEKSYKTNLAHLTTLQDHLVKSLKLYAENNGYDSYTELPGASNLDPGSVPGENSALQGIGSASTLGDYSILPE